MTLNLKNNASEGRLGGNDSLMCRQLVTDFHSARFQGEQHVKAEGRRRGQEIKPKSNFQSKVGPDELSGREEAA